MIGLWLRYLIMQPFLFSSPLLFSPLSFIFKLYSTVVKVCCWKMTTNRFQTMFSPGQYPSFSSWPILQTQRPSGTSQSPSAPQYNLGVSLSSAFSTHAPLTSTREDESMCGTVSGKAARFLSVDGQRL